MSVAKSTVELLDSVSMTYGLGDGDSGRAKAWKWFTSENEDAFDHIACDYFQWRQSPGNTGRISMQGLHDDLSDTVPLDRLAEGHPRAEMYRKICADPRLPELIKAWIDKHHGVAG